MPYKSMNSKLFVPIIIGLILVSSAYIIPSVDGESTELDFKKGDAWGMELKLSEKDIPLPPSMTGSFYLDLGGVSQIEEMNESSTIIRNGGYLKYFFNIDNEGVLMKSDGAIIVDNRVYLNSNNEIKKIEYFGYVNLSFGMAAAGESGLQDVNIGVTGDVDLAISFEPAMKIMETPAQANTWEINSEVKVDLKANLKVTGPESITNLLNFKTTDPTTGITIEMIKGTLTPLNISETTRFKTTITVTEVDGVFISKMNLGKELGEIPIFGYPYASFSTQYLDTAIGTLETTTEVDIPPEIEAKVVPVKYSEEQSKDFFDNKMKVDEKDNTLLYVGIGAIVLMLVLIGAFLLRRSKKSV